MGDLKTKCPTCESWNPALKAHDECLTNERVGWMLHPFPPVYFSRVSVQAIAPLVVYVGPLPQHDSDVLRIHEKVVPGIAYVYVISTDAFDVLYVGKTVNPAGRLRNHRHGKPWWPESGNLTILAVGRESKAEADSAAFHLEKLAIRDLRPIHNIAGVVA